MRIDPITLVPELMKNEMNITQFSKISGIPRQTLYQLKGGQRCSEALGTRIAAALGIPLEQLKEKSNRS